MKILWSLFFAGALPLWCATTALFQPNSAAVGPFPTNALTTPASSQLTGIQINLPAPSGCSASSASTECVNATLLNQLDGFSVNPRITVCFSAAMDPSTLQYGIHFIPVDRPGAAVNIDQILFDPAGLCAYAKPAQVLDQQTRYLLAVTSDAKDVSGVGAQAAPSFTSCVPNGASTYCQALSQAITKTRANGTALPNLVSASVFTTLSATTWLQKARAQVNSGVFGAGTLLGSMSTFDLSSEVQSITWMPQTSAFGFNGNQNLPLNLLSGVDKVAFGMYWSPVYLNLSGPQAGTINTTPTNQPIASPNLVLPVSFHVYLPSESSGKGGKFPVVIYGHGLGDNQFGAATYAASTWARKGFATIAIEITGHGFGPLGITKVVTKHGTSLVPTPGRGIVTSLTAPIGPSDGCILPNAIATRDCSRQTAVDLFALIRAIQTTNGLGIKLDPSRIYYTGQSFGSIYGTLFEAVEPNVSAGTLNVGGGSQADIARLSPIARSLGAAYLGSFNPPLLNVALPPYAPSQAYFHDGFNDEYVYRGQVKPDANMPVVPGALDVQAAFEQSDWLGMIGDPLSFAQHLQTQPLAGVRPKPILLQFGLGDLEVPNPTELALMRAGGLQSSTWVLHTEIVARIDPRLLGLMQAGTPYPIYPHRFLSNPTLFDPATPPLETVIAVAAQNQIVDFFDSNGAKINDPNLYLPGAYSGIGLFQPPAGLPDNLNFLQIQP